jgi:Ca2+-binding RTX toxin-like protein
MAGTWTGPTFNGDDTNDVGVGGAGNETLWGNKGDDNLNGAGGNDYIDGGVGNDTLNGAGGNDVLTDVGSIPFGFVGLIGHDTLRGGEGDDELRFYSPDTGDIADGGNGIDLLRVDFSAGGATTTTPISFQLGPTSNILFGLALTVAVSNIERVIFRANDGNDILTGGALSDGLYGDDGNDTLKGMGGDDTLDGGTGIQYIDGGADFDRASFDISGATNAVTLNNGGNVSLGAMGTILNVESFDYVRLGNGNNAVNLTQTASISLLTGSGADNIKIGNGGVSLSTGAGNDTIRLGDGYSEVNPGDGNDTVFLGGGNDEVNYLEWDSDFNNRLSTGADKIYGEGGDDDIYAAAGADLLDGGDGSDTIFGGGGADSIFGRAGNDTIHGEAGADIIDGGDGDDQIDADEDWYLTTDPIDNDTLNGGNGNDRLIGGLGLDRLNGGAGDDTIQVGAGSAVGGFDTQVDLVDGGTGTDTLYVFPFSYYDTAAVEIALAATTLIKFGGVLVAQAIGMERLEAITYGSGNHKLTGGAFDDRVITGQGNSIVKTLGGNDSVDVDYGNDQVDSGDGNDTVTIIGGGTDNVLLGTGDDKLTVNLWQPGSSLPQPVGAGVYDGGTGIDAATIGASFSGYTNLAFNGSTLKAGALLIGVFKNFESFRFTGNSAFSFTAGAGNDTVIGSTGNDVVNGGAGDDTLTGNAGDDTLNGGDGNDTINGGIGLEKINAGAGDDAITVTLDTLADTVDGGIGTDSLTLLLGGLTSIIMTGNVGTTATIKSGAATIATVKGIERVVATGGTGNDALLGGVGDDVLGGGAGANKITAGTGDDAVSSSLDLLVDTLDGGAGNDSLDLFTNTVASIVMSGNFATTGGTIKSGATVILTAKGFEEISVLGGAGNDTLIGSTGNDNLQGGLGLNNLSGLGGDDGLSVTLDATADVADGGAGNDSLFVSAFGSAAVIVSGNFASTATIKLGAAVALTAKSFESVSIFSGSGNDLLTGSAGADSLWASDGKNTLNGLGGNDILSIDVDATADVINGGAGDDQALLSADGWTAGITMAGNPLTSMTVKSGATLLATLTGIERLGVGGTAFNDLLLGGASDDTLTGGGGKDSLIGSGGNDTLDGGALDDALNGGANDDVLRGGSGIDTLIGSSGIDTASYADLFLGVTLTLQAGLTVTALVNGVADDKLTGIENIWGSAAADVLTGDTGSNLIRGGNGQDVLDGGGGNDTVDFSDQFAGYTVTLTGAVVSGALALGFQQDTIKNFENVFGGFGADTLTGDAGVNIIRGGAGADVLKGGAGADRFIYLNMTDSAGAAPDTIADFALASGDVVDLKGIDTDLVTAGDQGFAFKGAAAFTIGGGAQVRYAIAAGVTTVYADSNGDGVADLQIAMTGNLALTVGDFAL